MEAAGAHEAALLGMNLRFLGAISNIAPMALITTEFGLFVGIPALGAYHYLRGKLDSLVPQPS